MILEHKKIEKGLELIELMIQERMANHNETYEQAELSVQFILSAFCIKVFNRLLQRSELKL